MPRKQGARRGNLARDDKFPPHIIFCHFVLFAAISLMSGNLQADAPDAQRKGRISPLLSLPLDPAEKAER
jgi:hypothetical protein